MNYAGDLSARPPQPPELSILLQEHRDLWEQSSHPAPEARLCPPLSWSLEPHGWRLTGGSHQTVCSFLLCATSFSIHKKIYKQRYRLASVDIIITTYKWWHSPRAQEVIPVNTHTPSCLCVLYLEIPVTLSQQTCGIHEQVSSFWYILPYLSDGRSSLLQLD